jgi:hypothetical protein
VGPALVLPGAPTGNAQVDATTLLLQNILAQVAEQQGQGFGSGFGIKVHTGFGALVKAANIPGIAPTDVEHSFSLGDSVKYGTCGSVRTDVLLRNSAGKVIAVYDVKTGNAILTPDRAAEIRAEIGGQLATPNIPVIELKYTTLSAIQR